MTEDEYLALVERLQRAMAVEPFVPNMGDIIDLLDDWRQHHVEICELQAERQGWADLFSQNMKAIGDDNARLRAWKTEASTLLAAMNEHLAGDARLGESFVTVLPRVLRERDAVRAENALLVHDNRRKLHELASALTESERLRAELQTEHDSAVDTDHALTRAEREIERLRAEIEGYRAREQARARGPQRFPDGGLE